VALQLLRRADQPAGFLRLRAVLVAVARRAVAGVGRGDLTPRMAPSAVHRRPLEHVVADQPAAGAEDADGLSDCLWPVTSVMEHREGEDNVEALVGEGKCSGVGLLDRGPMAEGEQQLPGRVDHLGVEVGRDQPEVREAREEPGGHRSTSTAELEALA